VWCAALVLGAVLFVFMGWPAVVLSQVPSVSGPVVEAAPPSLGFRFERPDHPRLAELAERERLRDLIRPGATPFEQILSVKDWAAGQWPAGNPNPYPPWDALIVLDWIRAGTTGGFCAQYSQLLLQSLAALGFRARYVEIGAIENPYAHYVVEVWSPDHGKWVLMDADYNLHFERNGVPLSALDIHDALLDSTAVDLDVVRGTVREGHSTPDAWSLRTAELYYYVRYHLKANHISEPDEPPFDRYNDMVGWSDDRVVPWRASTVESAYPKEPLTRRSTRDRRLAEPPPGQIQIGGTRAR
jgi:hypothetical protein